MEEPTEHHPYNAVGTDGAFVVDLDGEEDPIRRLVLGSLVETSLDLQVVGHLPVRAHVVPFERPQDDAVTLQHARLFP